MTTMAEANAKIAILSFFIAWICLQCEVHGHPFVSPFRGGRLSSNEDYESAKASLAVVGKSNNNGSYPRWLSDATGPACFLFHSQDLILPFGSISNLPNDLDSVETLSFLCDVVVILATDDEKEMAQVLTAVLKGANRRLSTPLQKGRLLMISTPGEDSSKVQEQVRAKLAGTQFDSHEIETITMEALESKLHECLSDATTISTLLPGETNVLVFAKLLYQVYRSNQGSSEDEFQYLSLEELKSPKVIRHLEEDSDTTFSGENIESILSAAQSKLAALEAKLESSMLSGVDDLPVLDFGNIANDVLNEAYDGLIRAPPAFRRGILVKVVSELERLYKDHVQSLRNYYGKRYETEIEKRDDETEWTAAAEHMTQGFQAAANHAVPTLCQPGKELAEGTVFDSMNIMNGLINDMIEATNMRKEEQSRLILEEEEDEAANTRFRSRIASSIPPWLKKLAGRAVVLGVNYVQGWLAWQGLKRAAAERDRNMPKFPLF